MTRQPAGASILFVNGRGEVLLRQRGSEPGVTFPGQWDTIGGAVEPGESHAQAAVRETAEEIGLELRNHVYWRDYQGAVLVHVYAAPLDLPEDQIVLTEGARVAWLSLDQALELPLLPWVRALLPLFVTTDLYHRARELAQSAKT